MKIILVPGIGCRSDIFADPFLDALRKPGYEPSPFDFPRLPEIRNPRVFHDLLGRRERADLLKKRVKMLNEPVILLGHSAGADTCAWTATMLPQGTVKALVMFGHPPIGLDTMRPRVFRPWIKILLVWGFWKKLHPKFTLRGAKKYMLNSLAWEDQQFIQKCRMESISGRLLAELGFSFLPWLKHTNPDSEKLREIPTLVAVGTEDKICPPDLQYAVTNRYKDAWTRVFKNQDHISIVRSSEPAKRTCEWLKERVT